MPSAACAVLTHNAAPLLKEWLLWHLALGFERILVLDAGSTDETQAVALAAEHIGPVELHEFVSGDELSPEELSKTLTAEAARLVGQEQDWLLVLDVDEFLDPETTLENLLATAGDADAIAINWCIYGKPIKPVPAPSVIQASPYRSAVTFPDNRMARLLVRTKKLPTSIDVLSPDLSPERIVHPDGTPVDRIGLGVAVSWKGARILHYVWAGDPDMPPHLADHYFCRDEEDLSPRRRLPDLSMIRHDLMDTQAYRGLESLLQSLTQEPSLALPELPDAGSSMPDHGQHEQFSFNRVRPSAEERLLLTPQSAPLPTRTRACFIQDVTGDFLVVGADGSPRFSSDPNIKTTDKLVGIYQDSHPEILMLSSLNGHPVQLGNQSLLRPVLTICWIEADTFIFADDSGFGDTLFQFVPTEETISLDLPALPAPDTAEGLSFKGFCAWFIRHPHCALRDVARVIAMLSEMGRKDLGNAVPELQTFL
ncbi:glycosyltransferase family 2 protein [Gluconobacter cerinus]|uniref:glycosyltransferase family 2 protein n=1 Tax=Gluconobacter cerinus TaxID=38307 RepID=UPI001C050E94|nr:glycosyltransferase family 2 protein [Gluconobacter cerinus]